MAVAPPSASAPWGTLWVDRHLHKNGGSTLRETMLRNEEAGNCLYYGYTQTREGWNALTAALRTLNGSSSDARRRSATSSQHPLFPRLCIEAHASQASAEFTSLRIPDMLSLREHFRSNNIPMKVVLTTRVREPLSYYISFYRWRIAGMQRGGNVIRLSATKSVVQPLGSTFLDWAPENLQSIGLLHGDIELFAGLKGGGWPGVYDRKTRRRPHPYWVEHHHFDRAEYKRLLATLAHYDVVAPTEEFDEHLLLTSDLTGIPPLQEAQHAAVKPDPQGMRGYRLSDLEVCPNMTACREHVERIAPWDVRLYKHVRAAFHAQIARGDGGVARFAARLGMHRAARARNEGICDPGRTCCCADRLPCFNITGRDRRYRVPPPCAVGPLRIQKVVASDMPLGWCCTNRPVRAPKGKAQQRAKGKGRGRRPRARSSVG